MQSSLLYKIAHCKNRAELDELIEGHRFARDLIPEHMPELSPSERQEITRKRAEFERSRRC